MDSFKITNFGPINKVDIQLGDLTILLGPQASGKTLFLQMLKQYIKKETKIELTISLGAKEFKMPNLVGLDEQTAKLELLKMGFLYQNIEVLEKYDENSQPDVILEQSPVYSEKVNNDIVVKIYVNTYKGEPPMGGGDDDEILSGIIDSTIF